jgi:hypothetical protein
MFTDDGKWRSMTAAKAALETVVGETHSVDWRMTKNATIFLISLLVDAHMWPPMCSTSVRICLSRQPITVNRLKANGKLQTVLIS